MRLRQNRDELIKLLNAHGAGCVPAMVLADNLGWTLSKLYYTVHAYRISLAYKNLHWSDHELIKLIELRNAGNTWKVVGKHLGRHKDSCNKKYKEVVKL